MINLTDKELSEVIADLQAENSELRGLLSSAQMHLAAYVINVKDFFMFEKSAALIDDIKRVLDGKDAEL